MSEFKAGDRVKCVRNDTGAQQHLKIGEVYVVRCVVHFPYPTRTNVQLDGVRLAWCVTRFVKIQDAAEAVATQAPSNIYARTINGTTIDVYDIVAAYGVTNAAAVHAIKKLLMAGRRGAKSEKQDYEEACAAVRRAVELCEKGGAK